jgi:hypothetical protein
MESGVKVVGSPTRGNAVPASAGARDAEGRETVQSDAAGGPRRPQGRSGPGRTRRRRRPNVAAVLAVLGLAGTLVFGVLWARGSGGGTTASDGAVTTAAHSFLVDLTNFNAKSVDSDFNAITSMATGQFSTQAQKFFNSSIRTQLENALAESRGQIRNIYVQNDSGGKASVYAVVDQVYVNNKITTPQSDVLRIVVNLEQVGDRWMISNVTVLEGATPASAGSPSGSAGSTVPGQ